MTCQCQWYANFVPIWCRYSATSEKSLFLIAFREKLNNEYREKYRALYDQEAERELVIRDKGYIETDPHITAMIGVKGKDGHVKAIR